MATELERSVRLSRQNHPVPSSRREHQSLCDSFDCKLVTGMSTMIRAKVAISLLFSSYNEKAIDRIASGWLIFLKVLSLTPETSAFAFFREWHAEGFRKGMFLGCKNNHCTTVLRYKDKNAPKICVNPSWHFVINPSSKNHFAAGLKDSEIISVNVTPNRGRESLSRALLSYYCTIAFRSNIASLKH